MRTYTLYLTCYLTNSIADSSIRCFQLTNINSISIICTRCNTFKLVITIIKAILSQGNSACIWIIRICTAWCNCYAITICNSCVTCCIFKCSRLHILEFRIYCITNCFTCLANHHIIARFESNCFISFYFFSCCSWCAVNPRAFCTNSCIPASIFNGRFNLIFRSSTARLNVIWIPSFIS